MPDSDSAAEISAAALLRLCGLSGLVLVLLSLIEAVQTSREWPIWLTFRQVFLQDIWLASAGMLVAAIAIFVRFSKPRRLLLSDGAVWGLAFAVGVACYAGHYLVLCGYDLTRDEQMVGFDSWILQHGALVWPLQREWQADAPALNLMFMLPVQHPVAWASDYLPGNALLHALVGLLGDPALTAPLLTALSLPLLRSVAGKLWPGDAEVQVIPAILFLTSGQVLLSGMTAYAMAAHLFCNLAWLRLFLADRRDTDLAALALGWFATGLHQPLFHPMFAAPFILLTARRRQRLVVFGAGYAAIGLFWLSWPGHILSLVSGPNVASAHVGGDYVSKLGAVLAVNSGHAALLGANLLRFVTWQNIMLLPLMLAASASVLRDRMVGALALGLVLPIVVMGLILPWQGNGFGYRYLHPVIGNAFLLAGFGWRRLDPLAARLRPAFMVASFSTLLLVLPLWLWMSHARYAPFAKANNTVEASGADYLVLDSVQGVSYGSLVLNRPDLSNRPLRLAADKIVDPVALARRICKPGTSIAMAANEFFRPSSEYFGVPPLDTADAALPALRAPYESAGCRIVLLR